MKDWSECPKCFAAFQAEAAKAQQAIEDSYGKIPKQEFDQLEVDFDLNYGKAEPKYTLRQEFSQGMTRGGEYYVSYECCCQKCGFEFQFKRAIQVYRTEG